MERTIDVGDIGFLETIRNAVRSLARFIRNAPVSFRAATEKDQDRMTDDGAPSRS